MSEPNSMVWSGASGANYTYWVYPFGQTFTGAPGNYIFGRLEGGQTMIPLYIGQTADLSERFDNHHKWDAARRERATHILVHANRNGEAARLAEERDLVRKWMPCCNG